MRVLFVLHAPRDPKAAVFAYAEERRAFLQAQGHEGEVWTPQDFPRLRRWHPRWLPLAYPWVVLRRLLRGPEAFDLVMFHSFAGWASLLARPFSARLEANSMVVQFHGLEPLYLAVTSAQAEASGRPFSLRFRLLAGPVMNALLRLSCRRADAVLVLNQAERNYLSSREWAEPERIAVVANAAPSAFLALREDAREPGRLLFLGQWLAAKGIAELVAAFEILAQHRPGARLCCLGTRRPAEEVLAEFPASVAGQVEVIPSADRGEIARELERAEVFVFPSHSEGASLALAEALAAGLPVVATRVGAAADLLVSGESALLVEPGDAAALAAAVERFWAEPELGRRCGARAREVARGLSAERVLEQDLARMLALVKPRRPTPQVVHA